MSQSSQETDPGRKRRRPWKAVAEIIAVVAALAGIISVLCTYTELCAPTRGRITAPDPGSVVESRFTARVELTRVPRGRRAWLAVQRGDLVWPKTEIPRADRVSTTELLEPGSPGPFALVLFTVDGAGQDSILSWRRRCEEAGDCPGLAAIPGSEPLDSTPLRLR